MDLLLNQKKYHELINSIEYLKQNGGVLLFINKPKHNLDSTMKEFGIGAQILKELGISKMTLLTSASAMDFVGLSGFGLEILKCIKP
jgi:3,4-dihydroxy 2-butanone 4-phosphate synthase/GTP cyclohydrolase II